MVNGWQWITLYWVDKPLRMVNCQLLGMMNDNFDHQLLMTSVSMRWPNWLLICRMRTTILWGWTGNPWTEIRENSSGTMSGIRLSRLRFGTLFPVGSKLQNWSCHLASPSHVIVQCQVVDATDVPLLSVASLSLEVCEVCSPGSFVMVFAMDILWTIVPVSVGCFFSGDELLLSVT